VTLVFEANKNFSPSSAVAKRLKNALDFLATAFKDNASLLRTRSMVESLITLACKIVSTGKQAGNETLLQEFFERSRQSSQHRSTKDRKRFRSAFRLTRIAGQGFWLQQIGTESSQPGSRCGFHCSPLYAVAAVPLGTVQSPIGGFNQFGETLLPGGQFRHAETTGHAQGLPR
jgi:hypothetical protein